MHSIARALLEWARRAGVPEESGGAYAIRSLDSGRGKDACEDLNKPYLCLESPQMSSPAFHIFSDTNFSKSPLKMPLKSPKPQTSKSVRPELSGRMPRNDDERVVERVLA